MQKRVAVINDLSGYGRCSLTVALPIISAAGLECSVIPTAVLSAHTGFPGSYCRDMTSDMRRFARHWAALDLKFNALYSGYLCDPEQTGIVCDIIDSFRPIDGVVVVDPAFGDDGKLYAMQSSAMVSEMASLCKKADVITPNLTEAAFLTETSYRAGAVRKQYIYNIINRFSDMGVNSVIITGVLLDTGSYGCFCWNRLSAEPVFIDSKRIDGIYSGTGDVFASTLTAGLTLGLPLVRSAEIASDFVLSAILATPEISKLNNGVCFETVLSALIKLFGKEKRTNLHGLT
jgi:pyridoxine kinase